MDLHRVTARDPGPVLALVQAARRRMPSAAHRPGQDAAQRDLVAVLEVGPDGQAAGQRVRVTCNSSV